MNNTLRMVIFPPRGFPAEAVIGPSLGLLVISWKALWPREVVDAGCSPPSLAPSGPPVPGARPTHVGPNAQSTRTAQPGRSRGGGLRRAGNLVVGRQPTSVPLVAWLARLTHSGGMAEVVRSAPRGGTYRSGLGADASSWPVAGPAHGSPIGAPNSPLCPHFWRTESVSSYDP